MPIATVSTNLSELAAVLWIGLIVSGSLLLLRARRAVLDTTLLAAWWWTLAAWLAVITAGLVGMVPGYSQADTSWHQSLQMAAAMTTLCPAMAMLGAKRPQYAAWQWIVLSLWVVLSLPAAEWLLFAGPPAVHTARRWFLLVLLLPGIVNYLPTRHAGSAVLFGIGQAILLAPYLPAGSLPASDHSLLAATLFVAALAAALRPRRRPAARDPLDQLWRDFCNFYGLIWSLRVAERFNAAAVAAGWPVRLSWRGFRSPTGDLLPGLSTAERAAMANNLTSWLSRFVSSEWIAKRLSP
ncbi:MAG TPA: hypothetical protein VMF30_00220 [Pirellulales bacterium]|nr:hypothetical protein [Pirellulales bacterium]